MRRLDLLRHAKSSWDEPALDDADRPLAPRGRKAVRTLESWLAVHDVRPSLVLCSPAERTLQTLDPLLEALGAPEVQVEACLYHASAASLLERVRRVPPAIESLLIVGHNPGLHDLVLLLAAPSGGRERVEGKLPTGALVRLTVDTTWATLDPGAAHVDDVVLPRELRGTQG